MQNITVDNVSMNDKSLRILGKKLKADSHDFNAMAQCSQSVFLIDNCLHADISNSCFSHAVAIAEGKFLSTLLPGMKKKHTVAPGSLGEDDPTMPTPKPSNNILSREFDGDADDENTEEDIEALAKEAEAALAALPVGSEQAQVKLTSALLLKVRGFIAKVSLVAESQTQTHLSLL